MKQFPRLRIYLAGPYSAPSVLGVLGNIQQGLQFAGALMRKHFPVYCPWLDNQLFVAGHMHGVSVGAIKNMSLAWVEASDVLIAIPGWQGSSGTLEEIELAKCIGIPVFKTNTTIEFLHLVGELDKKREALPEHFNAMMGVPRAEAVKVTLFGDGPLFENVSDGMVSGGVK